MKNHDAPRGLREWNTQICLNPILKMQGCLTCIDRILVPFSILQYVYCTLSTLKGSFGKVHNNEFSYIMKVGQLQTGEEHAANKQLVSQDLRKCMSILGAGKNTLRTAPR